MPKKSGKPKAGGESRYHRILARIFDDHYRKDDRSFEFNRTEIESVAKLLRVKLPKNIGDAIYSLRYEQPFQLVSQPRLRLEISGLSNLRDVAAIGFDCSRALPGSCLVQTP